MRAVILIIFGLVVFGSVFLFAEQPRSREHAKFLVLMWVMMVLGITFWVWLVYVLFHFLTRYW